MSLEISSSPKDCLLLVVKSLPANVGRCENVGSITGLGRCTPVFLPGESHGQRSLGDYSL